MNDALLILVNIELSKGLSFDNERGGNNMREWFKRLQIKGFVAGVLVTIILSGTLFVAANTGGVMREVFYDVNIVVNGVPQNFPEDMTPFITGGRTFLPVRGIAEVFDMPVEWDGETSTVYIGQRPQVQ